MKLLFDFLPIILFFVAFKVADANKEAAAALATGHFGFLVSGGVVGTGEAPVLLATLVVIVATLAQVALLALRGRKIDLMLWVSLTLVVVMGGLTVWLHNETFIKWKPTLLYWVMACVFALAPLLFGRNVLKLLLGEQLQLPDGVWKRLNLAWVSFFAVMGALNLWVAYTFETSTWVNFKLFGSIGLMFVFTIVQGLYLGRYLPDDAANKEQQR
jgi:intracellular septation protein